MDFMVSLPGGLNEAPRRVELRFARKYADFHFVAFFFILVLYAFVNDRPVR